MRKHDPETQEGGFHLLQPHAGKYIEELITEFKSENDLGLRCWLLELIGDAKSPKALPLLVECLRGDEEHLWSWAMRGLKDLNTKEARQVLWEARGYTKQTDELTRYFQDELSSDSNHLVSLSTLDTE